jgi:hypothetical protein
VSNLAAHCNLASVMVLNLTFGVAQPGIIKVSYLAGHCKPSIGLVLNLTNGVAQPGITKCQI